MRKIKILILVMTLTISGSVLAQNKEVLSPEEKAKREKNIQAGNPFKKFGYTPKIATLSKGKYLEFHDLDSIVPIGSVMYNVNTQKIVSFKQVDTLGVSEATLEPEVISRWFSPDPLAEEFPSWSPYNFVENNPIIYVDPDGLAPMTVIGADKQSQKNIRNQLPASSQKYVKFDANGVLDKNLLAQGAKAHSSSGNYQRLLHLAQSEDTYVLSTADHYHANDSETGEIETVGLRGSKMEPNGSIGINLFADKTVTDVTQTSIDENTNVIVSNKVDEKQQVKTTAHELVHSFLYDMMKNHGSSVVPIHEMIPKMEDGEIIIYYTSPKLIKPAEKEAVKNYEDNKKN